MKGARGCVSIQEWVGDLSVMYLTSCWVIVPLMIFAYVFGVGLVQSQCV